MVEITEPEQNKEKKIVSENSGITLNIPNL